MVGSGEQDTAKRKLERLQFSTSSSLSKFEVPVVVNLKHIFERFGLYTSCFLDLIRVSSDG